MKEFPLFYIAALELLSVGIYLLSLNQITTVKINKQKKTVSVQRKSLVKNKFNVYGFSEIAELIYVDKFTDESGTSYKLLPLESGKRIQLSSPVSCGQDQCYDAADVINNLIFDKPEKIPYNLTGFKKP